MITEKPRSLRNLLLNNLSILVIISLVISLKLVPLRMKIRVHNPLNDVAHMYLTIKCSRGLAGMAIRAYL